MGSQKEKLNNRQSMPKLQNQFGTIKNIVAVMSGKGGVGKSLVTALLAVSMAERGYSVGVMDADITGPSIPKLFGLKEKVKHVDVAFIPVNTVKNIKVMSINLLLPEEDKPVIWRGPLLSGAIRQFYEEVDWGDLDFLFVDLPPGTGDVPLTVMQLLPVTGLVIVSSPQDLVSLIVKKAINMASTMQVPVIGLVENMSYLVCPRCGEKIEVFGQSSSEKVAREMEIRFLGRLPIIPDVAKLCDEGRVELVGNLYPDFFSGIADEFMHIVNS